MNHMVLKYIIYFFIYSFVGWILDSVFSSLVAKQLIFGGMFKTFLIPIPLAPIYGFGAVILILMFNFLLKSNILLRLFLIVISLTMLEYIGGFFTYKLLGRRVWDYTGNFLNLNGHVDVVHSLFWLVLGLVFIYFIHPFISIFLSKFLE